MILATDVFKELTRLVNEVADIADVPANRRDEFCERLTSWIDAGTEWGRIEIFENWKALSNKEQRGIESVRNKLVATYNAALALGPAQKECVDVVDYPNKWIATLEALERLAVVLNTATCTSRALPHSPAKRRPKGRTQAGGSRTT
jgi:hypothetical protein